MVSTFDGHELFRAQSHRYSVDVAPAVDPIDICINSAMTAIDLRDIKLARTESEVGREIVMRLPIAQRNIAQLREEAVEKERSAILESEASGKSGRAAQSNIELAHDENSAYSSASPTASIEEQTERSQDDVKH